MGRDEAKRYVILRRNFQLLTLSLVIVGHTKRIMISGLSLVFYNVFRVSTGTHLHPSHDGDDSTCHPGLPGKDGSSSPGAVSLPDTGRTQRSVAWSGKSASLRVPRAA